ncbi:hypothetical protein SCUCBS95973_001336 [Sporothrix curviconia]|uniref:Uncharacterized protein n=1 Tax=Sporothrix curviconia TaxID=1260050 RepID=A0ABP0AXY0_9PEZI
MTSKSSTAPIGKAGLNERELLLVAAAFSSLKGDQAVDWSKFTALAGYASSNSARVCFRPLQKKLGAFVDSICKDGFDKISNSIATPEDPGASKPSTAHKPAGAKTRGRPKKRKLEVAEEPLQADDGADGDSGNAEAVADVKPEPDVHNTGGHDPVGIQDSMNVQKVKVEDGSPSPVGNNIDFTSDTHQVMEPEESREYQGFFYSCDEHGAVDYGESLHASLVKKD